MENILNQHLYDNISKLVVSYIKPKCKYNCEYKFDLYKNLILIDGCYYDNHFYFIFKSAISESIIYNVSIKSHKMKKIKVNLDELYFGITIVNNKIYLLGINKIIVIDLMTLKIIENINCNNDDSDDSELYYHGLMETNGVIYYRKMDYRNNCNHWISYNTNSKIIQSHETDYMPENIEYIKNNEIYHGQDVILPDRSPRTFFDYNSIYLYKSGLLIFNNSCIKIYQIY